jgi:hypothetical protein
MAIGYIYGASYRHPTRSLFQLFTRNIQKRSHTPGPPAGELGPVDLFSKYFPFFIVPAGVKAGIVRRSPGFSLTTPLARQPPWCCPPLTPWPGIDMHANARFDCLLFASRWGYYNRSSQRSSLRFFDLQEPDEIQISSQVVWPTYNDSFGHSAPFLFASGISRFNKRPGQPQCAWYQCRR